MPTVTRAMQIDQKSKDHPAGGRGRGRGRGKGRGRGTTKKDDDDDEYDDGVWDEWMKRDQVWDGNWHWAKGYGWYWEDKAPAKPAKTKGNNRAKNAVASAGSTEPKKKKARNQKDKKDEETKPEKPRKKTPSPKPEPEQAAAPKAQKGKERSEPEDPQPKKRSRKEPQKKSAPVAEEVAEFKDAPTKSKDIKKEIYEFLVGAKDLTDENAREKLKAQVPKWSGLGVGMLFNIYWTSRGVKGVGVGVTSKKQQCDFAFFGYKSECDSWIYAIAAAIKSADILATSMHICSELFCLHLFTILTWQKIHDEVCHAYTNMQSKLLPDVFIFECQFSRRYFLGTLRPQVRAGQPRF